MRLSAIRGDHGYREDCRGVKVFFQGYERSHVYTADEEKRFIIACALDDRGCIQLNAAGDEVLTETLYGDVRIELPSGQIVRERLVFVPERPKRWRCNGCEKISLLGELLIAPNPFDASEMISGCPFCKSIEGFSELCDEPECERNATSGFPASPEFGGYRRTCFEHFAFAMTTEGRVA